MREKRVYYVLETKKFCQLKLSEAEQPVFTVEMTSFCMRCVAGGGGSITSSHTKQSHR